MSGKVRATVVGVAVVVVATAVLSGAVAFGLVLTLRAMGPDVPEEPDWPSSVESVDTRWSGWTPGITFAVIARLNTRDGDAVILAAQHAVAVKDPNGHGRAIRVSFAIDGESWTIDQPLPLDVRRLAAELAEIPPP